MAPKMSAVRSAAIRAASFDDVEWRTNRLNEIDLCGEFVLEDIPLIAETHIAVGDTPNTAWDHLRGKHLRLPSWFQSGLDPLSVEYKEQQLKLWRVLANVDREYAPEVDEAEAPLSNVDAVRFPGFYIWRNEHAIQNASHHVMATGMLMRHSGLKPGMWALEYGAGFAQAALAFARMGVNVDTVDISETFCGYVKQQADFFGVNLTPFKGVFGHNPRGSQKYNLIWFYESFHHCVDFRNVVERLKEHLAPGGRVLLAGEPIRKHEYAAVPYPWGLRLESEVIAVIRRFRWFELGYSEDFITTYFVNNGYVAEWIDCPHSPWGMIYSFRLREPTLCLGQVWIPSVDEHGWHTPEPEGRWTRGVAAVALDTTECFCTLVVTATNHHPKNHPVRMQYGEVVLELIFKPGETRAVKVDARKKASKITISCETLVPTNYSRTSTDTRALGIFVRTVEYL